MGKTQREKYIEERRGAYTGCVPFVKDMRDLQANHPRRFGVAGVLLEMVPVAGILFAFTNTCGAALWAADMEKTMGAEAPQN